jgi:hypothetical protein
MGFAMAGVACIDMSAPSGPASISALRLPSPSVVAGDVMRDSNGAPAPLAVIGYDANGAEIGGLGTEFFITDTTHAAHIDAAGLLSGDKIGFVRVLGQIGVLQTAALSVPVTYAPDRIVQSTKLDTMRVPFKTADTTQSVLSTSIPVRVRSALDSSSQGFVVKYRILSAPATAAGAAGPAVYLADETGRVATADTSDASGIASPKLVVRSDRLADLALQAGTKSDSVVLEASARYKGVLLANAPLRLVAYLRVVPSFK